MTSRERSPILPLIWLCFAVLLIPVTLRVLYAVQLTQRQCQSGPLEKAILRRDLPAVRRLLDHGASPNTRLEWLSVASVTPAAVWKNVLRGDHGGTTPILMLAAETEATPLVQLLLERGANPNIRDRNGGTPLMSAASQYHGSCYTPPGAIPTMRLLIAHGADVNAQDLGGETALSYAVADKKLTTVKFLLEQGAAMHIKGGESVLVRAVATAEISAGTDPAMV